MSKTIRGLLVGAVSCVAFMGFASAAMALTVSPSGAYTATATGSTLLTLDSTGQALSCTASTAAATISSNGAGRIPVGGLVYSGCTNGPIGPFSVIQNLEATIRVVLTLGPPLTISLEITIPRNADGRGGVLIRSNDGRCAFDVSGTVSIGKTFAGPLPVAITTADIFSAATTRGTLTVGNVSATCSPFVVVNGLRSTYSGSYRLSRAVTVSG